MTFILNQCSMSASSSYRVNQIVTQAQPPPPAISSFRIIPATHLTPHLHCLKITKFVTMFTYWSLLVVLWRRSTWSKLWKSDSSSLYLCRLDSTMLPLAWDRNSRQHKKKTQTISCFVQQLHRCLELKSSIAQIRPDEPAFRFPSYIHQQVVLALDFIQQG